MGDIASPRCQVSLPSVRCFLSGKVQNIYYFGTLACAPSFLLSTRRSRYTHVPCNANHVFKIEIYLDEIKVTEIYYERLMEAKFESTVCEREGEVRVIKISSAYERSIQYNGGTNLRK